MGQFSETKSNYFAEQFTKDGKILYYKIYRSVWSTKVSSHENLNRLDDLLNGLEKAALSHLMKLTGDGSISVTSANILELLKDLLTDEESPMSELTDTSKVDFTTIKYLTSVSKVLASEFQGKHNVASTMSKIIYVVHSIAVEESSLNKMLTDYNSQDFVNPSFKDLLKQLKDFLVVIGKEKVNGDRIDEKLTETIPKAVKSLRKYYEDIILAAKKNLEQISSFKTMIRNAFEEAKKKLEKTKSRKHNILAFLLDVLLPGFVQLPDTSIPEKLEPGYSRCMSRLRAAYREPYGDDEEAFENDKNLQKMLKEYGESSTCDVVNFFDDIIAMKKDKGIFIDSILDKTRDIVLKMLDENVKSTETRTKQV